MTKYKDDIDDEAALKMVSRIRIDLQKLEYNKHDPIRV